MSQRNSEYARKDRDLYQTPEQHTQLLERFLPTRALQRIWEPAAGSGQMVDVFQTWGAGWYASDVHPLADGIDQANFFNFRDAPHKATAIITNPPYRDGLAQKFIEHALKLMKPCEGVVAMLLSDTYDFGVTRRHLFAEHPAFCKKIALHKRIIWFPAPEGEKQVGPSQYHAWYLWDWAHRGPATMEYA